MRSSLAVSPSSRRPVGMPVQASTTSAISWGPTSSLTIGSSTDPALSWADSAVAICDSSVGMRP